MARERVVIAMSGGVDSSVAAALLVEQGFEVIGISMRLYDADPNTTNKGCCSPSDLDDARAAAAILKIPHYVFDMRDSFQRHVIDDFVDEYLAGRTPNPCVRCNQHIKFDALWEKARRLGASSIATGHYARIEALPQGGYRLLRGADPRKDQSYFLFPLTQEHLARIRFPVGGMQKEEVRKIARQLSLPNADKPDSQEICFVSGKSYIEVVEAKAAPERLRPGLILDEEGKEIGQHKGIHTFTVGQRRGLPAGAARRYVASIDPETGLVRLGPDEALKRSAFFCTPVVWTDGHPRGPRRARVFIRYQHKGALGEVRPTDTGAEVTLDTPERAITPGQSAVFYDGDAVLGGGWIS